MNKHYFLTLEEQLERIRNKNIIVDDPQFAIERLKNTSYYSLINPYKDCFIDNLENEYMHDGTRFEHFYLLHIFDISLSNLLLKYIIHIEFELKSGISYVVAKNISDDENIYLNNKFYASHDKIDDIKKERDKIIQRNEYLIHYVEKEGNIPPWVLIKALSMGKAINWLRALKGKDKVDVYSFLLSKHALKKLNNRDKSILVLRAITHLNRFRNLAAHGERSVHCQLFPLNNIAKSRDEEYMQIFDQLYPNTFKNFSNGNDLYNVIIDISLLLRDPLLQKQFLSELSSLISFYNPYFEDKISLFLHIPYNMEHKIKNIFDESS